jgi:hypothetical protein
VCERETLIKKTYYPLLLLFRQQHEVKGDMGRERERRDREREKKKMK